MVKNSKLEEIRSITPDYVKKRVDGMVESLDEAYKRGWRDSFDRRKLDPVSVLELYSLFLERNGYIGGGWRDNAIDEFLKEYKGYERD